MWVKFTPERHFPNTIENFYTADLYGAFFGSKHRRNHPEKVKVLLRPY